MTGVGVPPRGRANFWIAALAVFVFCLPMFPPAGGPLAADQPISQTLLRIAALQGFCGTGQPGSSHRPDTAPHDHEHCLRCAASGVLASTPPLPLATCRFSGVFAETGPAIRVLPPPIASASFYRSRAPPVPA